MRIYKYLEDEAYVKAGLLHQQQNDHDNYLWSLGMNIHVFSKKVGNEKIYRYVDDETYVDAAVEQQQNERDDYLLSLEMDNWAIKIMLHWKLRCAMAASREHEEIVGCIDNYLVRVGINHCKIKAMLLWKLLLAEWSGNTIHDEIVNYIDSFVD